MFLPRMNLPKYFISSTWNAPVQGRVLRRCISYTAMAATQWKWIQCVNFQIWSRTIVEEHPLQKTGALRNLDQHQCETPSSSCGSLLAPVFECSFNILRRGCVPLAKWNPHGTTWNMPTSFMCVYYLRAIGHPCRYRCFALQWHDRTQQFFDRTACSYYRRE